MRTLLQGFAGWARLQHSDNPAIQAVDLAITVVGTLLVAMTWMIVRR